jgi:hypothetical protein
MIIIKETQQVLSEDEFRASFPNISFQRIISEDVLDAYGAAPIFEGAQPFASKYEYITLDGVELINGKYFTKYTVRQYEDITAIDNQAAEAVRSQRNQLLKDSDWTQLSDAPVNKDAWSLYRQALRDITSQAGFPHDIEWPAVVN